MAKGASTRYAKALAESCKTSDLEGVRDALNEFVKLWHTSADLRDALRNPANPLSERLSVIQDLGSKLWPSSPTIANFLALLLENGRVQELEDIASSFSALIDEIRHVLSLEVASAFPLTEAERGEIQAKVASEFGALASVQWSVDRELLGGLRVKAGDKLLDGSVQGSLARIKAQLLGN